LKLAKFTIEGQLAGANEAFGAANRNRYVGARIKRAETKRCAMAAIAARLSKIENPVRLRFHWVEPHKRRDLDNIRYAAKYILDGMREARVLPNDGWSWVVGMSDSWAVDKVRPRIEVTVEEIDGIFARRRAPAPHRSVSRTGTDRPSSVAL
jgi:Holliday junction resolvase RusA-like endonuclease